MLTPRTVASRAFARLIPALDEVVVHVRRGGSGNLDIGVVDAAATDVAGGHYRAWIDVDPADEGSLRGVPGIDHPRFLMLAEGAMSTIPADANARAPRT